MGTRLGQQQRYRRLCLATAGQNMILLCGKHKISFLQFNSGLYYIVSDEHEVKRTGEGSSSRTRKEGN